jgi:hypothetical protein
MSVSILSILGPSAVSEVITAGDISKTQVIYYALEGVCDGVVHVIINVFVLDFACLTSSLAVRSLCMGL